MVSAHKVLIKVKLILLLICVLSSGIYAGVTGKIAGQIIDTNTGEPLVGANVLIKSIIRDGKIIDSDLMLGASTDVGGNYFILNIPPGTYVLEALYIGYGTTQKSHVKVSVDYTTRIDFELNQQLEETETVVVISKREMVRKDLTSSIIMVDSEEMERLPVRSIADVIELQAGVVKDAGGALHIRGGRSTEIAYLVDGVQVLDPLSRAAGLTVDNQAVEELQTITGTFNAEYGQALSGVINTITKRGSQEFEVNFTTFLGDFLSFDKDVYSLMDNSEWAKSVSRFYAGEDRFIRYDFADESFENKSWLKNKAYLNSFDPTQSRDFQANISGPISFITNKLTFFVSGRYVYDPGFIYGKRYFMPWGFEQPEQYSDLSFKKANNEIVPLGWNRGLSLQSKLFYNVTPTINTSYSLFLNDNKSKGVGYNSKYVPDGGNNNFTSIQTHIFSLNHTLSPSTFYEMKLSYFKKDYETYLYKDPTDPRYVPNESGQRQTYLFGENRENALFSAPLDFAWLGNSTYRGENLVENYSAQVDLSSQVNKNHFVKIGVSGREHTVSNIGYNLQFTDGFITPYVPGKGTPFYDEYEFKPKEYAAYIQDKIEFDELIINIGLRFDYFDPDGRILADPSDPQIFNPFNPYNKYKNYSPDIPEEDLVQYSISEREQFWYKKPKAKSQISPRFGLSFPITEKGVIHFSYGHFFQNPAMNNLFANSRFWVRGAGTSNLVGNADIGPERTIMYEVGLQQQLFDNFFLHVTGFYRDIRDWVGTGAPINTYGAQGTYYQYENKDHATAKGITLNMVYNQQRMSFTMDYTFMVAKGTSSNPQDAYNDALSNKAPRIQLINLAWDQRHSITSTFGYQYERWYGSLIARLQSGFPYTPSNAFGEAVGSSALVGYRENSEFRPVTYNMDLRVSKKIEWLGLNYQLSFNVFNLLDIRNPRSVYSDTGQPDYSSESRQKEERIVEIASVKELFKNPGNYYPPRFIQIGLGVSL